MGISVPDAKNRLSELLRSVEAGDDVTITRSGKPAAQLVPPLCGRPKVRFGTMRGRIHTTPGWDAPVAVDQFLSGEF